MDISFYANGAKGHHRFTLQVVEVITDDSVALNTSYINYTFKISPLSNGWDWNSWGNKISYTIKIGDNTYSGTIPAYDGYSTVTLKSGNNIPIVHNADGTKTLALEFNVVDGAKQNYTPGNASASNSLVLTALHKPPIINVLSITERNSTLTAIGVPNNTLVQYLSNKRFVMDTPTLYDDATIVSYTVYHNSIQLGTSNTNTIDADFSLTGELMTIVVNNDEYVPIQIVAIDSLNAITTITVNYAVIKYTRPIIQKSITSIKRKTGGGTTLNDNIVVLNLTASCYKEDNIIGNNNTPQIQYKIWGSDITEPSYSTTEVRQLDGDNLLDYETNKISNYTLTDGNINVSDYEIEDVGYLKSYDYKIKISDTFTNFDITDYVKEDRVPTGKPVWTEYKDRVDFSRITIENKEVVPNEGIGNYAKIILSTRYTSSQSAWSKINTDFTNSYFNTNNNDDFEQDEYGIICNFDGVVIIAKTLATNATSELDIVNDINNSIEVLNITGHNTYYTYVKEVSNGELVGLKFNPNNTSFTIFEGTQISIVRIK